MMFIRAYYKYIYITPSYVWIVKIPCFYSETGRFEILKATSASVVKATVDCRANACAFPQGIHPICR